MCSEVCGSACVPGQLSCGDLCCLDATLECDGVTQCSDAADEKHCGQRKARTHARTHAHVRTSKPVIQVALVPLLLQSMRRSRSFWRSTSTKEKVRPPPRVFVCVCVPLISRLPPCPPPPPTSTLHRAAPNGSVPRQPHALVLQPAQHKLPALHLRRLPRKRQQLCPGGPVRRLLPRRNRCAGPVRARAR